MACGALHIRLRPYRELATWSQSSASVCTNPDKLFPSHGSESVLPRGQCPLMASHQSAQMPTPRLWPSICLEVLVSRRITYAIPRTPLVHHFSSSPPLLLLQPHPHPLVLLGSQHILPWVSCFLCLCAHLRPPISCPESSLAWRWKATMQPASHMHVQLEVQAGKWLKDHPRVMEERSVCSPFILRVLPPKAHFLRLLWSPGGIASVVGSGGQFLSTPLLPFSPMLSHSCRTLFSALPAQINSLHTTASASVSASRGTQNYSTWEEHTQENPALKKKKMDLGEPEHEDSWEQRSVARDISGGGRGDPVAWAQNDQGQSYLSTKGLLDTMSLSAREPVDRVTAVKLVLIELSQHRGPGPEQSKPNTHNYFGWKLPGEQLSS